MRAITNTVLDQYVCLQKGRAPTALPLHSRTYSHGKVSSHCCGYRCTSPSSPLVGRFTFWFVSLPAFLFVCVCACVRACVRACVQCATIHMHKQVQAGKNRAIIVLQYNTQYSAIQFNIK